MPCLRANPLPGGRGHTIIVVCCLELAIPISIRRPVKKHVPSKPASLLLQGFLA